MLLVVAAATFLAQPPARATGKPWGVDHGPERRELPILQDATGSVIGWPRGSGHEPSNHGSPASRPGPAVTAVDSSVRGLSRGRSFRRPVGTPLRVPARVPSRAGLDLREISSRA